MVVLLAVLATEVVANTMNLTMIHRKGSFKVTFVLQVKHDAKPNQVLARFIAYVLQHAF